MDGLGPLASNFLILMILILIVLGVIIAVIIGISRLPPEKFNPNNAENAYVDETKPLTKEELLRSAVKALDQGDKELAKKLMDQAESMRD
jgi:uncharacterized protein HemY